MALSAFKVSFHEQHGREPVYAELKLERIYRDWRRIHRAAKRMAALTGGKPVASLEAKPTAESAAERRSCISVVKVHVDTADSAGEMGLSDGVATKEAEGDDGGEGDGGEEDDGGEGDGGEEVTDGLALAEGTQPVAMPAQARWRFNQNPTRAVQWIVRGEGGDGALSGFGHAEIASEIALWLLTEEGLLTSKVGEFLGGAADLNRDVLAAYIGTLTPYFSGATLDTAAPAAVQAVGLSNWAMASATLSGLWHLEGRQHSILADGSAQPPATVVNGTVTIPRASGRILAGLAYTCDLETLDIEQGPPTLQGRARRVQEVVLRVKATRGLAVGPDAGHLTEIKERTSENYGAPTLLTTGDERVLIDPSWNSTGRILVRQAWPLPATIVAAVPRLEVGE